MNTESITTIQPFSLFVGLALGIVIGAIIGFTIAYRHKSSTVIETKITTVQLLSVLVFFGYLFASFQFDRNVDAFIAIAILATGYGAKGGELVEQILERSGRRK